MPYPRSSSGCTSSTTTSSSSSSPNFTPSPASTGVESLGDNLQTRAPVARTAATSLASISIGGIDLSRVRSRGIDGRVHECAPENYWATYHGASETGEGDDDDDDDDDEKDDSEGSEDEDDDGNKFGEDVPDTSSNTSSDPVRVSNGVDKDDINSVCARYADDEALWFGSGKKRPANTTVPPISKSEAPECSHAQAFEGQKRYVVIPRALAGDYVLKRTRTRGPDGKMRWLKTDEADYPAPLINLVESSRA